MTAALVDALLPASAVGVDLVWPEHWQRFHEADLEVVCDRQATGPDGDGVPPEVDRFRSRMDQDAAVLDAARGFEVELARAQAGRARALAEFARRRPETLDRSAAEVGAAARASRARRPDVLRGVSEFCVDEVAVGLSANPVATGRLMEQSLLLVDRLPRTLAALEAGTISWGHAVIACELIAPLSAEARARAEDALVPRAAGRAPQSWRPMVRRLVMKLDAAAITARVAEAVRRRTVVVYPAADGLATLAATLPLPVARAVEDVLRRHAHAVAAPGDERSLGERMADCLVDLLLDPTGHGLTAVQAQLTVVASVQTLLGGGPDGDEPGEVGGDVVPAAVLRELAAALGLLPADRATPSTPRDHGHGDSDSDSDSDKTSGNGNGTRGSTRDASTCGDVTGDETAGSASDVNGDETMDPATPDTADQTMAEDTDPATPDTADQTMAEDTDPATPDTADQTMAVGADAAVTGDAAETKTETGAETETETETETESPAVTGVPRGTGPPPGGTVADDPIRRAALARLLSSRSTAGTSLAARPRLALVDKGTGELVALTDATALRRAVREGTGLGPPPDTEDYTPTAALAAFVRLRDRRCQFPGCRARPSVCDLDHQHPWLDGGRTSHDNLACLCRHHHRLSHQTPGWQLRRTTDGAGLRWRTPTGQVVVTRPPTAGTDDAGGRAEPGAPPPDDPPPF